MTVPARADIVGNVWKIVAREGDPVGIGDTVAILETMKMEIPVVAPAAGHVSRILVAEGQIVQEGDPVAEIDATLSA
ncbi:biotin/lipoyl-binding carrier protein [Aeromicrobium sp. YIM 150415]|uniref:Biotin/lipoyl-binding carrier protein n=1 Tax=Aeromicrobium piscarium TaxID=2590901 RepID=A0A554SB59_9ACTN|nr:MULTISPECIES: biotin/lipoyl-binding carrier protein [Aeromicrobium]MBM9463214.1 biotin/lipoyl-binding carrier protein [Aeromicrobium sp. YIM 150415]TSD63580.1 biotin/lipoyl-binding carrier protein [Aeromicrobium piscarium]